MSSHDPFRRKVVTAIASLPLIATGASQAGYASTKTTKVLVAYVSRSGNTKVVAGLIQRSRNGKLFEIRPATPYPDDYLETVVPFITHGGYGLGDSLQVIVDSAPSAHVVKGFVMEGEQEKRTMENVNGWLRQFV